MSTWIGISGWQYPEWAGKFYPAQLPKSHWFEFYCRHFNTVEINYSFYHQPSPNSLSKWYQQAPADFRYSLKVHRSITHYHRFTHCKRRLNRIYRNAELLKEKLGCLLFQLPENFCYSAEHFANIMRIINPNFRNVFECRHPSWWQPDVATLFTEHHLIFSGIDGPDLPNYLLADNKEIYLRLHGHDEWYAGSYSKKILTAWANKIKAKNSEQAWIYFNNTMDGSAIKNAKTMQQLMN